jgi:hypothetical protein
MTSINEEFSFLARETYQAQVGNRNLLFNGDFANWNKGAEGQVVGSITSNSSSTSMQPIADGWNILVAANCITTGLTANNHLPVPTEFNGGPPVYYVSCSKAGTTDYLRIIQNIPDVNFLSNKQLTLSFYMKATVDATPMISIGLYYPIADTYVSKVTLAGTLSPGTSDNIMTKQEITFTVPDFITPILASSQVPNDPQCYTSIRIYPHGTDPSWVGTIYVSRAQLEYGPRATTFEHNPWAGKVPIPSSASNDLTIANTKFVKDAIAAAGSAGADPSAYINEALAIGFDHIYNVSHTVSPGSYLASKGVSNPADLTHTASSIRFVPVGGLISANVQSAIQELDTKKASKSSGNLEVLNLSNGTTATTQAPSDSSNLVATTAFVHSVAVGGISMEDLLITLSNLNNIGTATFDTNWHTKFLTSSAWGTGSGLTASYTTAPYLYDILDYGSRSSNHGELYNPRNFTTYLYHDIAVPDPFNPGLTVTNFVPYELSPTASHTFVNYTTNKTLTVGLSVDVYIKTDDGFNIMFFSEDSDLLTVVPTYSSLNSSTSVVTLPAYVTGSPTVLQLLPGSSLTATSGQYPGNSSSGGAYLTFTLENITIASGKTKTIYFAGMINGGDPGGSDVIRVGSVRYKQNAWA